MTLEGLYTVLNSIEAFSDKVAYRAFPVVNAPELPFICYMATDTTNLAADCKVYQVVQEIDIELYTEEKDVVSESAVETALDNAMIPWEKSEDYIQDQQCYMITYSITLIITKEETEESSNG